MSRAKPCPKVVDGAECGRPKKKGKQACEWHWLLRQSSDVQARASADRRESQLGYDLAVYQKTVPKDRWPEGERWCAGCQSFVPLFYTSGSRCKACVSSAAHARRLETVYDITAEEYDRILRLQGGRCAICRNQSRTIRFATDHDHKTGDVRGLLCKRCNHDLLGGGHDSVSMLWRAITYLLFPPAQEPPGATYRMPGEVVAALRAHLETEAAEAQAKLPAYEEPPF